MAMNGDPTKVEKLVKDLFQELWKRKAANPATAILDSFSRTVQKTLHQNCRMAGTWVMEFESEDETQVLKIEKNLKRASFKNPELHVDDLELQSSEISDELVYKNDSCFGFRESTGCFIVDLKLKYDPINDTIDGEYDVKPNVDAIFDAMNMNIHHQLTRENFIGDESAFTAIRQSTVGPEFYEQVRADLKETLDL